MRKNLFERWIVVVNHPVTSDRFIDTTIEYCMDNLDILDYEDEIFEHDHK